jgi:hypothetical protein
MFNHEDPIELEDDDNDSKMDTKEDGDGIRQRKGKADSKSSGFSFYSQGDSKEEKKSSSSGVFMAPSSSSVTSKKQVLTSDAIYDRLKAAEINMDDDPLAYDAAERLLDKEKEEYRQKSRSWIAKNNKQFLENAKPSHQEELEGDVEKRVLEGIKDRDEQPIFHKAANKRMVFKNPLDDDDDEQSHKSTSTKSTSSSVSLI